MINIRRAQERDLPAVHSLLAQVAEVHYKGRPDLFRAGRRKYTDEELRGIFRDDTRPVFVAEEDGSVLGYAFCIFQQHRDSHVLTDIKTLYIDYLCVDAARRGRHVGRTLYEAVLAFARQQGCYNVTLNVWACNQAAMRFYEKCGLKPQKVGMEQIL